MLNSMRILRRSWSLGDHLSSQAPWFQGLRGCHIIAQKLWRIKQLENGWCRYQLVNFSVLQTLNSGDDRKICLKSQTIKQILLESGCQEVEFYESPEVLRLSHSEVKDRLRRLKSLNVELNITPVMIGLARERKNQVLKTLIKRYQEKHGGQTSRARELRTKLNLGANDIKILAESDAKLLQSTAKVKSVECLEWLLWKGYSIKEIAKVPEVLDKSVEVISGRHKDITAFNLEHPPLRYLGMSSKQYNQLVRRFTVNPKAADTIKMTGHLMHARSTSVTNLKLLEPVWNFLRSHAFNHNEIASCATELLKPNFELLQDLVKAIKLLPGDTAHLHTIILLCKESVKSRKAALKRLLNCLMEDLPSAQRGCPFALFYAQPPIVYIENLQFLLSSGFSLNHIAKCPVIIGHRPQIVRNHWSYISDSAYVQELKQDRVKCLEMLQYEIEKESNFMQGILL